MEIEENQAHLIDHFVKQVSSDAHTPSSLTNLIVQATSHSSLFAFSEILALPNLLQVTLLFPITLFSIAFFFFKVVIVGWNHVSLTNIYDTQYKKFFRFNVYHLLIFSGCQFDFAFLFIYWVISFDF